METTKAIKKLISFTCEELEFIRKQAEKNDMTLSGYIRYEMYTKKKKKK